MARVFRGHPSPLDSSHRDRQTPLSTGRCNSPGKLPWALARLRGMSCWRRCATASAICRGVPAPVRFFTTRNVPPKRIPAPLTGRLEGSHQGECSKWMNGVASMVMRPPELFFPSRDEQPCRCPTFQRTRTADLILNYHCTKSLPSR